MNFPSRLNTFLQQILRENVPTNCVCECKPGGRISCKLSINDAYWTGEAATRAEAKHVAARNALLALLQLNLESRIREHLRMPVKKRYHCVDNIRDNLKTLKILIREQQASQAEKVTLMHSLCEMYPIIDRIEESLVAASSD